MERFKVNMLVSTMAGIVLRMPPGSLDLSQYFSPGSWNSGLLVGRHSNTRTLCKNYRLWLSLSLPACSSHKNGTGYALHCAGQETAALMGERKAGHIHLSVTYVLALLNAGAPSTSHLTMVPFSMKGFTSRFSEGWVQFRGDCRGLTLGIGECRAGFIDPTKTSRFPGSDPGVADQALRSTR